MGDPSGDDASPSDELGSTVRQLVSGIAWTALYRWIAQGLSSWPPVAKLAAQVATGALIYPAVLLIAYRSRVRTIYELIRESRRGAAERR
jgi:hypothetical protein